MINFLIKQIYKTFLTFASNDHRVKYLRKQGAKIGKDCLFFTSDFGSEPYLIEVGDHVVIAPKVTLINHDGAVWLFRDKHPGLTVFGKIKIGNNTFVGRNSTILHDTEIGSNCIIGAGSVVRGKIPDNSVAMGNPAKVVLKTAYAEKFFLNHKHRIDTKHMKEQERKNTLLKHFMLD